MAMRERKARGCFLRGCGSRLGKGWRGSSWPPVQNRVLEMTSWRSHPHGSQFASGERNSEVRDCSKGKNWTVNTA